MAASKWVVNFCICQFLKRILNEDRTDEQELQISILEDINLLNIFNSADSTCEDI